MAISESLSSLSTATAEPAPTAIGFIEAQGFIPMLEAVDVMTKAAAVEVGGTVKLGGGLISVSIRGDLASVLEALEVGEETLRALYGIEVWSIAFPNPSATIAVLGADPSLVID